MNRKRAGFEVRDVHISHYGRICPIETPEGTNIGLISSLAIYAGVDEYGFLVTPYRKVHNGKLTDEVVWLRADEESEAYLAPADAPVDNGKIHGRHDHRPVSRATSRWCRSTRCSTSTSRPSQMVGVSAGLIPFLEHDDANRALMGSNMQRQAVPLLVTEPPIVGTGMEARRGRATPAWSSAPADKGTVTYVDADADRDRQRRAIALRKFVGLNERTCQNQKPIVQVGEKVEKGQVIADGAATLPGRAGAGPQRAGRASWPGTASTSRMPSSSAKSWCKNDTYTSIHIEEFDIEIRETKLGREEFTRDIPNVSEKALRNLDENGIVRIGTYVRPGDILVGKVSPKSKTELTPEEKLLHAIFGRAGEDVKNDSLEVPSGVEGIVIDTQKFSRRMSLSEDERKKFEKDAEGRPKPKATRKIAAAFGAMVDEIEDDPAAAR